MAGLLTPNPNFSWGQFGGNALAGIGQGLLAYGAGGQLRQQAPLIAIQGMQQAQQAQAEQAQRALQTQSLTQQLAMQQMQMQRAQQVDQQAAQQKQAYLGLLGGQAVQGPTQSGAPLDIKSPVNPALANLPPAMQSMLPLMDPSQGMGMIAQASTREAKAPTTVGGMQYDATQNKFVPIPGYTEQAQAIAQAGRPPQQAPQAPADVQEYQFAQNDKQNPFKGSFTDFLSSKRGSTQMVQTGTDQSGNPVYSFQPTANSKPPTEDQAKSQQLFTRTSEQLPIVLDNFEALANPKDQFLSKLPGANVVTSPEYQRASNALTDIAASYLYSVSGATANPGEVANLVSTITPKIGESKESIADKKDRIKQMVDSIKQRTQGGQSGAANPAASGAVDYKSRYGLD